MGKKRDGYAVGRESWAVDWAALRTPLGLPAMAQALCLRTSFVPLREGLEPKPAEVRFYATSAPPQVAAGVALGGIIRAHWRIENCLHHPKDRTWLEDRHWLGNRRSGAVVSMLRSVACCLVRRARVRGLRRERCCPDAIEFFSHRPRQALKLITGQVRL